MANDSLRPELLAAYVDVRAESVVTDHFSIRLIDESDVEFGMSLDHLAGWNQVSTDWIRLVRYQPDGCFIGMINEKPVATISTTRYGTELAWIGMMLVHPDFRRRGIASALMRHVIQWLDDRGTQCIKLDATPAGATVYAQLGFQREWDFHRAMRQEVPNAAEPILKAERDEKPCSKAPASEHTAPEAPASTVSVPSHTQNSFSTAEFVPPEMDLEAFGVDRREWLARLAADSHVETCHDGFGMLRSGRLAMCLGPVIAASPSTADRLIDRLISITTRPIFWDVPEPNPAAVKLAERLGFSPVRPLTRMWRGARLIRGNVQQQFAISSPATG